MTDYYKILNINVDASLDDVKKAYRKLVKKYHPDNYSGSEKEASEFMSTINEAYDTLTDEKERFFYDKEYRKEKSSENSTFGTSTPTHTPSPDKEAESSTNDAESTPKEKTPHKDGCTSRCLSKIMEYIVFVAIILFLINHFHMTDKIKPLIEKAGNILNIEKNSDNSPKGCINCYFNAIQTNDTDKVTAMFTDSSFDEYTKTVQDIYHAIREDDMYYLLFKEIRNFDITIDNVKYNNNKTEAVVSVTVRNINCYTFILDMLLEYDSDEPNYLSQEEINSLVRKKLEDKEKYLADCTCTFTIKNMNSVWKISNIDDMKELTSILIGNTHKLAELTEEK